jgi:heptosyltransferase-2
MEVSDNILDLLREKSREAVREAQRGILLQPGALGDCVLTLPLAEFMKESLGLGGIDILGHTDYIGFLPGRTCIDGIRSIDSIDLHRLFVEANVFDLADRDPLINAFAEYAWIVTFLGEPDSNFEQNLIFTANCSHSAEVITVPAKPPADFSQHITVFFVRQFVEQSGLPLEHEATKWRKALIEPTNADKQRGTELLKEIGIAASAKLVVMQPGSGGKDKCWHLENFLTLAKELGNRDVHVLFLLGPAETDKFSKAQIANVKKVAHCLKDMSLNQVVALLSCADGFVGNDSGVTHLAAALGVRTLAVFGPTDPAVYAPIGPQVSVFARRSRNFAQQPSQSLQRELLAALFR